MKSAVIPSFWDSYNKLSEKVKQSARKTYKIWVDNPFHPSLHFKCINTQESVWSVRITQGYRAVGILEGDTVTWIWIGNHDDHENFFG